MHGRFWIPRNGYFYDAFGFILAMAWTVIVLLYYVFSGLEAGFWKEMLVFFDFNRDGNVGDWFLSMAWLVNFFLSLMICLLIGGRRKLHSSILSIPKDFTGGRVMEFSNYHCYRRLLFWGALGIFSLVMSIDTVCRFLTFFYHRASEAVAEIRGVNSALLLTFLLIAGVFFLRCFVLVVGDYLRDRGFEKITVVGAFAFTFAAMLLSLLFALTVPKPTGGERSAAAQTEEKEEYRSLPAKKTDPAGESGSESEYTTVGYTRSSDGENVSAEKEKPGTKYRDVYRTADLPRSGFTFEAIFGMNASLEDKLRLGRTLEESLELEKPLEDHLFDHLPKLTLIQTQTLLRRGFYGYFLALLIWSLGLLARVERLEYDDLYSMQVGLRMGNVPREIILNYIRLIDRGKMEM